MSVGIRKRFVKKSKSQKVFETGSFRITVARNPKQNVSGTHWWDNNEGDRNGYIYIPGQAIRTAKEKMEAVYLGAQDEVILTHGRYGVSFQKAEEDEAQAEEFTLTLGGKNAGYKEPLAQITLSDDEVKLLLDSFGDIVTAVKKVDKECEETEYNLYHNGQQNSSKSVAGSSKGGRSGVSGTTKRPLSGEKKETGGEKKERRRQKTKDKPKSPTPSVPLNRQNAVDRTNYVNEFFTPNVGNGHIGADCEVITVE